MVIICGENKGLTKSLNEAVDIATGEYIFRQDADDISYIKHIKSQLDFLIHMNSALFLSSLRWC